MKTRTVVRLTLVCASLIFISLLTGMAAKNVYAWQDKNMTSVLLLILPGVALAMGGGKYNPNLETPRKSLKKFRALKYGAFVHWNPSVLAEKEISLSRGKQTPREEYDNLYKKFNPTEFNAAEWVRIFKEVGFKYLVYVPKHHDGFCMWDTKTTDYNIMNSPFGRDVTKELANECKKQGIAFCLYYSIADFYQPDYQPTEYQWGGDFGGKGYSLPKGQKPNFDRYVEYMKTQLRELTESYGPILAWWFDANWSPYWTRKRGGDLYAYMRKLQPDVLVNNRIGCAFNGNVYMPTWFASEEKSAGDYAVLEVDLPRFNRDIPWEYTRPAYTTYSWNPGPICDVPIMKEWLIKSACGDGNFNLGISATSKGKFDPRLVDKLKNITDWLKKYGNSIYDTRGGPYMRTNWYGSTCKDNKVYLHIFKTDIGKLVLPPLGKKIIGYRLMQGGKIDVKQTDKDITVTFAVSDSKSMHRIVVLDLNGSAEEIKPIEEFPVNTGAAVSASNSRENKSQYSAEMASDGDMSTYWTTDKGVTEACLEYDLDRVCTFSRAILFEGKEEAQYSRIRQIQIQAKISDKWKTITDVKAWGDAAPEFDQWPISITVPEIRFSPTTAQFVRLKIVRATDSPVIHEFKLFER